MKGSRRGHSALRLLSSAASVGLLAAFLPVCAANDKATGQATIDDFDDGDHHHRHHGHHHHHHHGHHHHDRKDEAATAPPASPPAPPAQAAPAAQATALPPVVTKAAPAAPVVKAAVQTSQATDRQIMEKMQHLEAILSSKEKAAQKARMSRGQIEVNGPLPADFADRFSAAVSEATGAAPEEVKVVGALPAHQGADNIDDVVFEARANVIQAVRTQASDPESKLANGPLHAFLAAKDADADDEADEAEQVPMPAAAAPKPAAPAAAAAPEIDSSEMPYGDLEPFGREDTAQELTESSIHESDAMVDQLERAEVAEEKRAVFRALTRLRGAAITSYDGIARAQTGNIDEYARKSNWRKQHPVQHLAKEEADTARWAFPSDADF